LLALFFSACSRVDVKVSVVSDEKNEIVELIGQLAHADESTRERAFQELQTYLVIETDVPEFSERLTLFHKHAPHSCKAEHEAQTLYVLELFARQEDVSSVLVKQSLRSKHARVRSKALELAHFSDNAIDEMLLGFEPDQENLQAYMIALQKLGTLEAEQRLSELGR